MKTLNKLVISAVSLMPGVALASETAHNLDVKVPFSFIVAGENFTPGTYRVSETESGVVIVQGEGRAAAVISIPSGTAGVNDQTCLRFTKDGSQEYLSGVDLWRGEKRSVPVNARSERKLSLASTK